MFLLPSFLCSATSSRLSACLATFDSNRFNDRTTIKERTFSTSRIRGWLLGGKVFYQNAPHRYQARTLLEFCVTASFVAFASFVVLSYISSLSNKNKQKRENVIMSVKLRAPLTIDGWLSHRKWRRFLCHQQQKRVQQARIINQMEFE